MISLLVTTPAQHKKNDCWHPPEILKPASKHNVKINGNRCKPLIIYSHRRTQSHKTYNNANMNASAYHRLAMYSYNRTQRKSTKPNNKHPRRTPTQGGRPQNSKSMTEQNKSYKQTYKQSEHVTYRDELPKTTSTSNTACSKGCLRRNPNNSCLQIFA